MLSIIMEPLKNNPMPLGASQIQTHNHHAAASLSLKFVPAPLGVAHDTNATRPTARITAPPCSSHTKRTRGSGRAGAYEAGFVVRVVVVASSSARPVGCSGFTRNTATTRKRSAPPRNAINSDLKSSACGLFRTCLVAFLHCDATAGRPGGRGGHFSCLGCFSMTFGSATNQRRDQTGVAAPRSIQLAQHRPRPRPRTNGASKPRTFARNIALFPHRVSGGELSFLSTELHSHFSVPLNQRARQLPRSVVGRVGPGVAQLGVSRRGRRFVVCASRSVWCVVQKNTGRRLCFVFFGRESPPRAHPDRRLGWCYGVRRAAGLGSLRFHFGH